MKKKRESMLKFISPSWDSIFRHSVDLAQKIRYDEKKLNKERSNAIVGVSRGGLVLARLMSDLLEIENVMIAKSEYYTGMGKKNPEPVITQKIQSDISGLDVLLVDDVSDTGASLKTIKQYVASKRPKTLSVATLYLKPWSKCLPDYYISSTDAWIIFPWEYYESVRLLKSKGGPKLVARTKIPRRAIERLSRYETLKS